MAGKQVPIVFVPQWSTLVGPGTLVYPPIPIAAYSSLVASIVVGNISGPSAAVGSIQMWSGGAIPSGWRPCDGSAYSTSTYPELFGVIGYTFGGAAGTFNVPDFRDRFSQGAGADPLGSTGGARSPAITDPTHTHTLGPAVSLDRGVTPAIAFPATVGAGATNISIADGRPPYLTVHFVIRASSLGGGDATMTVRFQESMDNDEWVQCSGGPVAIPPPLVEGPYTTDLTRGWLRVVAELTGPGNPSVSWCLSGSLILREK